jgi:hypothetical protein
MRRLFLICGIGVCVLGALAAANHFHSAAARDRYMPATTRAAERINRELGLSVYVNPHWEQSWTTDLERLDVTVQLPFVAPTLDADKIRNQVEAIVREEFRGASLFSIQVLMPGRADQAKPPRSWR